jgi:acetyl/propionyl-CoA carboxylase alpha subunit
VIAQEYDSLFAKVIVKAAGRKEAISKITNVLEGSLIVELSPIKRFCNQCCNIPTFRKPIFTRWIDSIRNSRIMMRKTGS